MFNENRDYEYQIQKELSMKGWDDETKDAMSVIDGKNDDDENHVTNKIIDRSTSNNEQGKSPRSGLQRISDVQYINLLTRLQFIQRQNA
ncbi:unnamed protein product [Rhizophagus irregularis]|nr:unnamed protein product [Rhizophagus irregularis]